jgi:hypothetical protein
MRMTQARAHAAYERLLMRALRAADPVAALRRGAKKLPAGLRQAITFADKDGIRITALLVARLRFERLRRGCSDAEAWFEEDPEGFAAAFREYHASVAPTGFFPHSEARLFRRWLRLRGAARCIPLASEERYASVNQATRARR